MGSPRDTQRSRLYAAEHEAFDEAEPLRTVEEAQEWINRVVTSRWFVARWGRWTVPVIGGRGSNAHYRGRIMVSRWGRQPRVLLHELAHVLVSADDRGAHDPLFAACYLALVHAVLGADQAARLRAAYTKHRVRYRTAARELPRPTRTVPTKAAAAAARRAVATAPPSRSEALTAADVLARAVRAGTFGPAGRKPRAHALEVARLLRG